MNFMVTPQNIHQDRRHPLSPLGVAAKQERNIETHTLPVNVITRVSGEVLGVGVSKEFRLTGNR